MTAWLALGIVVAISAGALLIVIARASREIDPTRRALGAFRSSVQPALVRVQTETEAARARLAARETRR